MLTNIAGKPSYHSGDTVELEDRIAKAWIDDGLCVVSRDEKPIEQAVKR
jgi:hypothetical protein